MSQVYKYIVELYSNICKAELSVKMECAPLSKRERTLEFNEKQFRAP